MNHRKGNACVFIHLCLFAKTEAVFFLNFHVESMRRLTSFRKTETGFTLLHARAIILFLKTNIVSFSSRFPIFCKWMNHFYRPCLISYYISTVEVQSRQSDQKVQPELIETSLWLYQAARHFNLLSQLKSKENQIFIKVKLEFLAMMASVV